MSGMMANFFANLLPFFAFLWALNLVLFYRTLYIEYYFKDENKDTKILTKTLEPIIIVSVAALFFVLPIRTIINKCLNNSGEELHKAKYDEFFLKFPTDYDRENPVTKNEGFLRVLDRKIHDE